MDCSVLRLELLTWQPLILDVTKPEDIQSAKKVLEEKIDGFSRLILVNNAGIAVNGPWELVPEKNLRQQMEVNFFGAIFLTQSVLPILRKTKGHVMNVSSISGLFSLPCFGPYSCSKFAMEAFTDSLRREMLSFGVRVSSINPGPIKTPIWAKGLDDPRAQEGLKHPVYGRMLALAEKGARDSARRAIDVANVVKAVDCVYRWGGIRVLVVSFPMRLFFGFLRKLPVRIADVAFMWRQPESNR